MPAAQKESLGFVFEINLFVRIFNAEITLFKVFQYNSRYKVETMGRKTITTKMCGC